MLFRSDCYIQDAAAVLLLDGAVVAAVEQERLVRRKHTGEFPRQAIEWCLREAGIGVRDLDAVAFDMRPWLGIGRRALQTVRGLPDTLKTPRTRGGPWSEMVRPPRRLAEEIGRGS